MTQAYKRWCTDTINASVTVMTILRSSQWISVNNAIFLTNWWFCFLYWPLELTFWMNLLYWIVLQLYWSKQAYQPCSFEFPEPRFWEWLTLPWHWQAQHGGVLSAPLPPPGGEVITDRIASRRSILSSLSILPSERISSSNCIDSVSDKGSETGVRGDVKPPEVIRNPPINYRENKIKRLITFSKTC